MAAPDPTSPDKGRAVRGMFASIAPRYDLANRVLSMGQDQRWRAALVARLPPLDAGDRILDLCTGTGDVALRIQSAAGPEVAVVGADFCEPMVARAPAKSPARVAGPRYLVADAMGLPFDDGSFRAVAVAFGLRNVEDPAVGLAEMARVLGPAGRLLVLEFARPPSRAFRWLYGAYFFGVLPWAGRLLSGSRDAYAYLPASVWAFSSPRRLAGEMARHGLEVVEQRPFLFGAVILHVAERRPT